jgi:predicted DNA-binding transcriptional regulator AlpA
MDFISEPSTEVAQPGQAGVRRFCHAPMRSHERSKPHHPYSPAHYRSILSGSERQTILRLLNGESRIESMPSEATTRLLVTQKSTAELLSVSRVTIWRMKRAGQLNPVEILPGTWRYRYSEIAEIARGLEVQTAH